MTMLTDASGRPDGTAAVVLTDTVSGANVLADRPAVEAAGGSVAPFERDPRLVVDIVAATLAAAVLAIGIAGVLRARSWPQRRRHVVTRTVGLVWPLAALALGVALAPLLATVFFGAGMGVLTSWCYTTGMMPLVAILGVALVLTGAGVVVARTVALRRAARASGTIA